MKHACMPGLLGVPAQHFCILTVDSVIGGEHSSTGAKDFCRAISPARQGRRNRDLKRACVESLILKSAKATYVWNVVRHL